MEYMTFCNNCKQEKPSYLFPPSGINNGKKYKRCSKCLSASNGHDFGNIKKIKIGFRRLQAVLNKSDKAFNAKKLIQKAEIKQMLEQRKKRLAENKNNTA
jgi:hypothetical protein